MKIESLQDELKERVRTSRLLGADPSLTLHGGGNTSVKVGDVLYVKGSGRDLASIDSSGFAPVRLPELLELAQLEELTDTEMMRRLRAATLDPDAPAPSVEAILHALVPYRFVDHTHPDHLLSVMNTPSGQERVRELYGDEVVVIPYVMPGFALAKACADAVAGLSERALGMVLMHHGLVTFGDTADESYERTIELVGRAEEHLRRNGAWALPAETIERASSIGRELAELRHDISAAAGRPLVCTCRADVDVSTPRAGPATPDHVLRTKRLPMLGRDVAAYAAEYRAYFGRNASRRDPRPTMLDPAPRIVLDPELGLVAAGRTAREAAIAAEIYAHTVEVVSRAELLDAWQALPEGDIFDVEYWELEQAKLRSSSAEPSFTGEIALVTGAASGIGRACVEELLERGAAVLGLDVDAAVTAAFARDDYVGLACDVTDEQGVGDALETGIRAFGGLDMLVLNAGVFPAGTPISELGLEEWRRIMRVNADANVTLLREAHPLLTLAPNGGRVVVVGSKNVPAPGPGAAAYSASKAALTQLARVAALEWGRDGIRVNVVHPNAVFDTGLWSDEVLEQRAAAYGLSVDAYRKKNVLGVEVTSRDVARLVAEMCGPAFAKTTGAQVPVDGGNERVI